MILLLPRPYAALMFAKSILRFWKGIILMIVVIGCSSSSRNKLDQGVVVFDIEYINNSGKDFPFQLLPKTIEMKFNQNYESFTIEDRVGLFSISNILNLHNRKNQTLIKVFDKKYVYNGPKDEPPIFFKNSEPYDIKFLADTCRLAGQLCNKASFTDKESLKTSDILYTSNFLIHEPNANTPYAKVKGLLLQFGIQMKNLNMELTAKKIVAKEITDQEFVVPKDYKAISKNDMEEIINSLLP